jgi:hypothetical protein
MTEFLAPRTPAVRRAAGTGTLRAPTPRDQLTASLQKLWGALVDRGLRSALTTVDRVSGKLEDVSRRGGILPSAAGGGVAALVAGRNPIWGAVKGAVAGTSTTTKVLVVVAVVLALVLGPVVLVLLLLTLIVVVVVAAIRSATSG